MKNEIPGRSKIMKINTERNWPFKNSENKYNTELDVPKLSKRIQNEIPGRSKIIKMNIE